MQGDRRLHANAPSMAGAQAIHGSACMRQHCDEYPAVSLNLKPVIRFGP